MSNWPIHKDSWKSSSSEFNTLIGIWAETLVRKMWDARDCSFGGEHDDKPSNLRLPYVDTKPQKRIAGITRCSSQSQGGPGCPTSTSFTYRKDPPILSRYMCMYISYYHIISYHMSYIICLPFIWGWSNPQRSLLCGLFSLRLHSGLHSLRQTRQWRVHDAAELQLQLGLRGEVHNHCTWRCWRCWRWRQIGAGGLEDYETQKKYCMDLIWISLGYANRFLIHPHLQTSCTRPKGWGSAKVNLALSQEKRHPGIEPILLQACDIEIHHFLNITVYHITVFITDLNLR